jgi:hypothetical protein
MDEMKQAVEKQDSIKVSRNAKGQHAFEFKTYYDPGITPAEHVIEAMKAIEEKLLKAFPDDDGTD